ncbi:DUF2783 domain-containing protein [Duganella aceris]|uniref:DUF2783 domain-containing protein n=1 Tax=Duganella aceris TaxID=2703883 RepID=A0ABX0FF24_9BURK|nr:DUF2783 domain-containing protein [Duganella aceris]NGZ83142.1 DUF2783 domain-containing protein [Duganella aceris]
MKLHQNLDDYETFYEMLDESHQHLDAQQSKMLDAQLVLLLSNHIGDMKVLRQAFALARVNVERALPVAPAR